MGDEVNAASPSATEERVFNLPAYRLSRESGDPGSETSTDADEGNEDGRKATGDKATDSPSDDKGKGPGDDKPSRSDRRWEQLLSDRASARTRAELAEKRIQELEKRLEAKEGRQASTDPKPPAEPDPADYQMTTAEGTRKYIRDLKAHLIEVNDSRVEQKIADALKTYGETSRETSKTERANETWAAQVQQARAAHADFDDVAFDPDLPVSEALSIEIKAADNGGEMLYFIGKNPKLAQALYGLKGKQLDRALGRVEAMMDASKGDGSGPRKETNAQADAEDKAGGKPPPKTLGGSGTTTDQKLRSDLPLSEYRRRREAGATY